MESLATLQQLAATDQETIRNPQSAIRNRFAPLALTLPADLDTPLGVFLKLRQGTHSFLLESVTGGEQVSRYSLIGADPAEVLTIPAGTPDPLAPLRAAVEGRRVVLPPGMAHPPLVGGAVGFLSYEAVCAFEPVPPAAHDPHPTPLGVFGLYDTVAVFDHARQTVQVITLVPLDGDLPTAYAAAVTRLDTARARILGPLPTAEVASDNPQSAVRSPQSNCTRDEYESLVRIAQEHIAAGDIIQVVPAQRFERETTATPLAIYRALRRINPSPYMFFVQSGDTHLIGASPEMLVRVRDGVVATRPIAGTRARGATPAEDAAHAADLLADPKERAEHLMLVDLARNDVGRVSAIGTVKVPVRFDIEYYSHVMHIVSQVEGRLRADLTALDALRACFPAGTLSGAPKVRAMQIISTLERDRRGVYGGAVGYVGYDGNLDVAIGIRTIVLRDGLALVQAGAGIVADSVPAAEYDETVAKAGALLRALDEAENVKRDA
jgi:anthranilate synthase component 1